MRKLTNLGINKVAVCDGERLIAFRVRNHAVEQPPSLYYSTVAGTTLNSKYPDHPDGLKNDRAWKQPGEHGKHCIVASEPSTYKSEDWTLIDKNHCLMVDSDGAIMIEALTFPTGLNSSVNSL